PELLMAGALVAHMEGRGHACLLLDELLGDADALLGWPVDAQAALHAAMASLHTEAGAWTETLQASPLVATGDAPGSAPLVLYEGRL
ncbi:exodeoxyribonuclease V subunit alpha, partial [Halomonas sp. ND22Bw]